MLLCPMQHLHHLQQAAERADLRDRPHHGFLHTAVSSSSDVPQQQDHRQSRCFPKSFLRKRAACGKFSIAWTSCGQDARCLQFPRSTAHCCAGVDAGQEQPAAVEVAQLLNPPDWWSCSPVDPIHATRASKVAEVRSWSVSTNYLEKLWHLKRSAPFC
jgi:hypothetical protein